MTEPIPDLSGDLGPIEDYVGVNLNVAMRPSVFEFPIEMVGTKEAGYSVGTWVGIEGIPLGIAPAARTGLSLKGSDLNPFFPSSKALLDMSMAAGRWTPETFNGEEWRGGSGTTVTFVPEGNPPAFFTEAETYTAQGRWVSSSAVDFEGGETMSTPVPGTPTLGFIMVVSLYRTPDDATYGLVEYEDPSVERIVNPYAGLRYTADDYLEFWHNGVPYTTIRKYVDETEVNVVGLFLDDVSDTARLTLTNVQQKVERITKLSPAQPALPLSGNVLLGRSSGQDAGTAVMRVMDMAVVTSLEAFNEVRGTFASYYVQSSSAVPYQLER